MKLYEYFRSFTEKELVNGAELYLSGELKLKDTYELEEEDQDRFSDALLPGTLLLEGTWKPDPEEAEAIRRREWDNFSENRGKGRQTTQVWIHEKAGLIWQTRCSCTDFHLDFYGCPHCAGLVAAYMMKEQGEDIFRGTLLEDKLKQIAMTDDPFLPGVLRRTDTRLLSLLKDTTPAELPAWHDAVPASQLMKSICILGCHKDFLTLRLRVGPGHLYVIRDLIALLTSFEYGGTHSFGKKEYKVLPHYCEEATRKNLNFIKNLMKEAEKTGQTKDFFLQTSSKDFSTVILTEGKTDQFFSLNNGEEVELEEGDHLRIDLERKGLQAVVRKKTFGAAFSLHPVRVLQHTAAAIYVCDEKGIFRIITETSQQQQQLLALLELKDSLYIRESDMGEVVRNLLSLVEEHGQVSYKGLQPETYEMEKPEFQFYLDLPQKDSLTCIPYAWYPAQNLKCLLYDPYVEKRRRNGKEEQKVAQVLAGMFDSMEYDSKRLTSKLNEEKLYEFLTGRIPHLKELGEVFISDALRRQKVQALPKVSVGVSVTNGSLLLSMEGTNLTSKEMTEILSSYTRKKKYHHLKNGNFFVLEDQKEEEAWDALAELYQNYGKKNSSQMQLPLYRALYIQEMLGKREEGTFLGDQDYRSLLEQMEVGTTASFPLPDSLKGVLRLYQQEGFCWIKTLKRCGFCGILADDMGLGKTLQILSFLLSEKEEGKSGDLIRTLIICPASLVYNWEKEIRAFTPALTTRIVAGQAGARKEMLQQDSDADIWITSYDLLKRDIGLYDGIVFANEIIDEAQYIKNQNTQAAQSVRVIDSRFRMALTGTPIENHLSELWSIMDYLMPGFLYSYGKFQKEFETPIVSSGETEDLERLRKMVHPFILRRLKKDVLKELPDKLEEVVTVRMEGEQKRLYEALVEQLQQSLGAKNNTEFARGKLEILAELTKLRQICCDPHLLYENYQGGSAKLEACLQLIRQAVEGGHKILLFSQFTTMLDIIGDRLQQEKIAYHRIDGSVSKENRMNMVESFDYDEVPVFCISLKAGGTGLNLTAADIVIHYDPWWNQAAQNQATDRTHRIGQTQTVNVYELIAQGTIEEQIQNLKSSKAKLMEDVLSGESISSILINKEELLGLLE